MITVAHSKNRPTDDAIAQRIGEILEAIKTPEHADDIIEIRKIVRKNVPFFFRSYFAAYLLKDALSGGRGQRDRDRKEPKREREGGQLRDREGGQPRKGGAPLDAKRSREEPRRENREERRPEEKKGERMPPLPEGVEAATLFVSAGRKRHFYPRHLLELFADAGIPRESIGEIRLFDNYTFVQILASDANEAVEKLDGAPFKGRKLTVSFARKKEEPSEERRPSVPSVEGRAEEERSEDPSFATDELLPEEEAADLEEEGAAEDQGIDFDSGAAGEGLDSEGADESAADSSFEDVLYDPESESSEDGLDDEDSEGGLEELGSVDEENEPK